MDKLFSRARVDLNKDDLAAVKDLKVGGKVRIVLYGTLKALNIKSTETTDEGADSGSVEMDVSNVKVASNNEIAELMEEDV